MLIGAVPPLMLKTEANPEGLPREVFDGFRQSLVANRRNSRSHRQAAGSNRTGSGRRMNPRGVDVTIRAFGYRHRTAINFPRKLHETVRLAVMKAP